MDNIGPIALFILYMAISAWAKKNKAQRRAAREAGIETETTAPKEKSFMGGIFEQLKQELVEAQKEPQFIPYEQPEPEVELAVDDIPVPQFVEGSSSIQRNVNHPKPAKVVEDSRVAVRSLETILESYSTIEQGILLHEILGRPRAYQDNDDWFHKS